MNAAGLWRSDRLAAIALLALAAWVAWECRSLPLGTLARPGPAAWPLALAGLLALLTPFIFFSGSRAPLPRFEEKWHALAVLAAGAFAATALEPLGYRLTMLAVLLFLLGVVERRSIVATLIVSLGLALGTHYLFAGLLKVPLPAGLL